jgi:hypothetical protein
MLQHESKKLSKMGRIQGRISFQVVLTVRNGVVVRAMGAAIEKAVCLAFEIQRRDHVVEILTGTTEVVDDVIPEDKVHVSLMVITDCPGYGIR